MFCQEIHYYNNQHTRLELFRRRRRFLNLTRNPRVRAWKLRAKRIFDTSFMLVSIRNFFFDYDRENHFLDFLKSFLHLKDISNTFRYILEPQKRKLRPIVSPHFLTPRWYSHRRIEKSFNRACPANPRPNILLSKFFAIIVILFVDLSGRNCNFFLQSRFFF